MDPRRVHKDMSPRLDPGYVAYINALHRIAQVNSALGANPSLVNASMSLNDELDYFVKQTALVSPQEANELELHFLLPDAEDPTA